MYYTIYKITNQINGKYYIGQHVTDNLNDHYLGGGVLLLKAQKKYGRKNFTKEILFVFDNFDDMNNKEIEIVTEEFVKEGDNYNLQLGGAKGLASEQTKEKIKSSWTPERRQLQIARNKEMWTPERRAELTERNNKRWTEEARAKMSERVSGENNPMFGKGEIISAIRNTPEELERQSCVSKELWQDEDYKKKLSEYHSSDEAKKRKSEIGKLINTPEMKKQKSEKMKQYTKTPEHRLNILLTWALKRYTSGKATDADIVLLRLHNRI